MEEKAMNCPVKRQIEFGNTHTASESQMAQRVSGMISGIAQALWQLQRSLVLVAQQGRDQDNGAHSALQRETFSNSLGAAPTPTESTP